MIETPAPPRAVVERAARQFWRAFRGTPLTFNDVIVRVSSLDERHLAIKAEALVYGKKVTNGSYTTRAELEGFPAAYNEYVGRAIEGLGRYLRKRLDNHSDPLGK